MKRSLKTFALVVVAGVLVMGSVFTSSAAAKKVTRNGDDPGKATFTQGYANSTLSGTTAVNSWSGFSITLPGVPTIETSGDGTDWYYEADGQGMIICSYYPITKFGSGDIASFINGLVSTGSRQFVGGALSQTTPVTYGSLSFYQLVRQDAVPLGSFNDYCLVRELPGSGYVQVIIIDNEDVGDTLNNVLGTIA